MRKDERMVYFAQCDNGGPIKIGCSEYVRERLRTCQAACPYRLVLIGICYGSFEKEGEIHQRFEHLRKWGEWFNPGNDLLAFISEINDLAIKITLRDIPTVRRARNRNDKMRHMLRAQGSITRIFSATGVAPSTISAWQFVPSKHVPQVAKALKIPETEVVTERDVGIPQNKLRVKS